MPPKKGPVQNVIEALREPVRTVTSDVKKQVGNMPLDLVRMLYVDPEHKFKTKEELEQIEKREEMHKLKGFREARRKLDALQGKFTTELTITDEERKHIEEEEKRLAQGLQRFETTTEETARSLGQERPEEEAQVEQQRTAQEEQEEQRKKEEEKLRLETQIEAPPGKVTGLAFGRKRTAARMMRPPKSAETRTTRE